ncbi:MAG TPA: DUF2784 domain-containing protein [Balneolales bacterium]|nr:DUF2784 domain-containing protein [Balneolales bacterium]
MLIDQILNIFFFVFHTAFTLFNAIGWVWKKTRLANLITLILTGLSWFVLGIWYGIGYCPCTDWHWQVRAALGYHDMPMSYMKFLLDHLTGLNWNPTVVDYGTLIGFILALAASITLNISDFRRREKM